MLVVMRTVDDGVVERLFGVYAESMGDWVSLLSGVLCSL